MTSFSLFIISSLFLKDDGRLACEMQRGAHIKVSVQNGQFSRFPLPICTPYLKHSCQDKRLIKKIVLTDGMFM